MTVWKDPATGETFVVDVRTGNSYSQNPHDKVDEMNMARTSRLSRVPCLPKKGKDPEQGACSGPVRGDMPNWLQEALNVRPKWLISDNSLTFF